ncbi:trypsin-like peptidase domain-containing protein [uncultured Hyphomicrobium sp.]|uniref:trypsin-like serine peptidase n=1 Tax=uncultured Hyphomicrobium sp. TaxID=194373 RepID=UPI0025D6CAE4|nr:trypsin-like peptidase domain-containing protein [uncultured Hyphomicrobium sp.]
MRRHKLDRSEALAAISMVAFALSATAALGGSDACQLVQQFGLERFKSTSAVVEHCKAKSSGPFVERGLDDDKSAAHDEDVKERVEESYGSSSENPRSIYVEDDRLEADQIDAIPGDVKLDAVRRAVAATAILSKKRNVKSKASEREILLEPYKIKQFPLGEVLLCEGERFREQQTGGFCTAFLVGPDIVATAGHCVDFDDVDEQDASRNTFSVVFGFERRDGAFRSTVSAEEVFDVVHVRGLSKPGQNPPSADFALLQLDRPVPSNIAVPLRLAGAAGLSVKEGSRLALVGHPSGLPKKLSFNGMSVAMEDGNATQFRAQLNAFHGNSGSPVLFYDAPDVVAGILVNGQNDFLPDTKNDCVRPQVYLANGMCNGQRCSEGVTKSAVIEPYLP